MITPMQAVKKVESEKENRKVTKIYKYGKDYLVIAPDARVEGTDYSDPYFLVDSSSGKVGGFAPQMDFKGYEEAMKNEIPM